MHYATKLKIENKLLRETVQYLRDQLRLIPQSRLDKYATANDDESTLAYRKCAQEVDRLSIAAIYTSNDMLNGQ